MNYSLRSLSAGESGILNTSKEDYWVKKVDKLMHDRRQVMSILKNKNSQIRKANQDNHNLSKALKYK